MQTSEDQDGANRTCTHGLMACVIVCILLFYLSAAQVSVFSRMVVAVCTHHAETQTEPWGTDGTSVTFEALVPVWHALCTMLCADRHISLDISVSALARGSGNMQLRTVTQIGPTCTALCALQGGVWGGLAKLLVTRVRRLGARPADSGQRAC